jgi:hypothetical protein
MNSKAFYRQANLHHAWVQDNMNSVHVALVASTVAPLLLPLNIMSGPQMVSGHLFDCIQPNKECSPETLCTVCTQKKVTEGFVKYNPRQQEPG